MPRIARATRYLATIWLLVYGCPSYADSPALRNSDASYQQLRSIGLSGESFQVSELAVRRDAATFHLHSGTVCFLSPVQGKVTGAVFQGDGNLVIDPPIPSEAASLKMLTKENEFSETFSQAVFRFTDATYDEIKRAGTAGSGECNAGALRDSQNAMRHNDMLKWNLEGRILQDILRSEPGGFFLAFIHGKRFSNKEIYAIDPHGAPAIIMRVNPEEVEFLTYDEGKLGVWAAFHLREEYKNGAATGSQKNGIIHIEHQKLESTIEKSGNLIGKATTTFTSRVNGLRVVAFDLYPTLRVQSVTTEAGEPLSFIQEDKKEDADLSVILPKSLAAGEQYTMVTSYSGKEAIFNEGNGNYYPIARQNWYPNSASSTLGEYTAYDMTFRIPKGMKIAATGTLLSEKNDGGEDVTVWKSEVPITVAGFNLGRFKVEEAKLTNPDYLVQSYANEELPDSARGLYNTTIMMKKVLAEGEVSIQLYSNYFGPAPYKRLSMTQQTACNYGQSWPVVVYLPICAFFDSTVRHGLGLDFRDRGYWKIVAPHEVAHQWWGHMVGFNSYRDQWMSEGFADMSASLFLQFVENNPNKFKEFWKDEREILTEKNKEGFRAIDVGPVTMGYRLSNSKSGFNITRDLIYPKGAYILHMIRMMMWDRQTGDQNFKALMHDFVNTYSGKAVTTEDFKAMVEKHMTPDMDADGNHRLDWFFNEYVYGTSLPSYRMDYATFDKDTNGDVQFHFQVTQSGVDNNFRMTVPIYLELSDGRTVLLGRVRIIGSNSVEQKISLRGLKVAPKRALVNYYYDVLAAN